MDGVLLFSLCTWAVFSRHVNDDIIGRHCLAFASIASAGYAYSGQPRALAAACTLIIIFSLYECFRILWRFAHDEVV
jgi:hypothetical protein